MEIEKGLEYVRNNSRAVLATRRRDGSPQMSPVTLDNQHAERDHTWECFLTQPAQTG